MKFRVYSKRILAKYREVSPKYFKTKKEAKAYAEEIGADDAVLQKKIAYNWYDWQ